MCSRIILDDNVDVFSTIHSNYLYTAISGVDSKDSFSSGRPKGRVGIFYKKSLSNKIKQLKTSNRRVCGIVMNLAKNYTCLLLSVYLPCDTYCNTVSEEYVKCIDYIETLLESVNCNSFICCGDFNTSFGRANAQTECLFYGKK